MLGILGLVALLLNVPNEMRKCVFSILSEVNDDEQIKRDMEIRGHCCFSSSLMKLSIDKDGMCCRSKSSVSVRGRTLVLKRDYGH